MNSERDDVETGEPVTELALLQEMPGPNFHARIQRALGRRRFAGQVIDLGLIGPMIVILEYVSAIFQALVPDTSKGGRE